jgi:hypothetical protein
VREESGERGDRGVQRQGETIAEVRVADPEPVPVQARGTRLEPQNVVAFLAFDVELLTPASREQIGFIHG